jgi:hypothetical protein
MAKDAFYFRHDANSRNDERVLQLRATHGIAGYGTFFALIEMMRESENFSLMRSLCVGTAFSLGVDCDYLTKVIDLCVSIGLFEEKDGVFSAPRLDREMEKMQGKSEKASKSALEMHKRRANAKQTHSERMLKDKTREEKIINKKIDKKDSLKLIEKKEMFHEFVTMTEKEHASLIQKFGEEKATWCIEELGNYKGAHNAKYSSDYMAILSWVVKKYDKILAESSGVGFSEKTKTTLSAMSSFINSGKSSKIGAIT